jgi:drug/metabolite transporter (DMT)-like permease
MIPALLTTLLWSFCVVAARRSVAQLGENAANFWRLLMAVFVLGVIAHWMGGGLGGAGVWFFLLSGLIGFGLGDIGVFGALSRLGSRMTILMSQCLAAPIAGFAEWLWLGTVISWGQVLAILTVLGGIVIALAPDGKVIVERRTFVIGILFGLLAAMGQGLGAVISRKAYAVANASGEMLSESVTDSILIGSTAGYQRLVGGIVVVALFYGISLCWRPLRTYPEASHAGDSRVSKFSYMTLTAMTGPIVGIIFFQWALSTTPSVIVQPIIAMTPLVIIPMTYWFEGDRPTMRQVIGAVVSVLGAIGLAFATGL